MLQIQFVPIPRSFIETSFVTRDMAVSSNIVREHVRIRESTFSLNLFPYANNLSYHFSAKNFFISKYNLWKDDKLIDFLFKFSHAYGALKTL